MIFAAYRKAARAAKASGWCRLLDGGVVASVSSGIGGSEIVQTGNQDQRCDARIRRATMDAVAAPPLTP